MKNTNTLIVHFTFSICPYAGYKGQRIALDFGTKKLAAAWNVLSAKKTKTSIHRRNNTQVCSLQLPISDLISSHSRTIITVMPIQAQTQIQSAFIQISAYYLIVVLRIKPEMKVNITANRTKSNPFDALAFYYKSCILV